MARISECHFSTRHTTLLLVAFLLSTHKAALAQQHTSSSGQNNLTTITTGNATHIGNVTTPTQSASNNTSVTSNVTSSSPTPTTFPIAVFPTTGALQGTVQAPFPANGNGGGSMALGPDDSYIAAAVALVPGALQLQLTPLACLIVALFFGVWML